MLLRIIGQGVCSFRYSLAKGKALRAARCGHVASLASSIRRQYTQIIVAPDGGQMMSLVSGSCVTATNGLHPAYGPDVSVLEAATSGIPPSADVLVAGRHVSNMPRTDICGERPVKPRARYSGIFRPGSSSGRFRQRAIVPSSEPGRTPNWSRSIRD
jgi:hypothetical protein